MKQRTGYPVMDEILESIAPTARTINLDDSGQMFAGVATIRAAIFDVIDRGHPCDKGAAECGLFHPWQFEFRVPERDEESENRSNFVDAVIARITELQAPPHDGVSLQNLCDFHKRQVLPTPTNMVCRMCQPERKGNDGTPKT